MEFEAVFDRDENKLVITENGKVTSIDADLSGMADIAAVEGSGATLEYIDVSYPDMASIAIDGPDKVSISDEFEKKVMYTASPEYMRPGTNVAYSVSGSEFVSIDESGIMTIRDGANGKVKLTVQYNGASAEKEVEIVPAPAIKEWNAQSRTLQLGSSEKFEISGCTDEYGGDALYTLRDFSSSDESVIMIDKNGVMTAVGKGTATITANAFTGSDNAVSVEYTVDKFYASGILDGDTTYVPGDIASDAGEYIVYYSDGTVEKAELSEIGAAVSAEDGMLLTIMYDETGKQLSGAVADGFYDIAFKKAEPSRGDIYVNGYMVGNNVDQADADRKVTDGALYTANDIRIEGGALTVSMCDGSTMLDHVEAVKKPEFYDRPQRLYIIGDSLACEYYGTFENEVGGGRSGWGQQIGDYLNIPVTNLANSGQYAAGLYTTAFPSVIENGEPGDILLIECAYNDRSYSTREEMTRCVKSMIEQCRANGIIPILVTPNASAHDYKPSVVWSSYLRDIAVDTECQLIDLSKESYDFLYSVYGDDKDGNITKIYNLTENNGDNLHSSYAGAYKWASIVAQGLKDLGYGEIINTEFSYTFTDILGNEIKAEIR